MAKASRNDRRLKDTEKEIEKTFRTRSQDFCVYRSNCNISAQIIDDVNGNTLVSASSLDKELKAQLENGETRMQRRL